MNVALLFSLYISTVSFDPQNSGDSIEGESVLEIIEGDQVNINIDENAIKLTVGPGMPNKLYLSRASAERIWGVDAYIDKAESKKRRLFYIKRGVGARIGPSVVPGGVKFVPVIYPVGRKKSIVHWYNEDYISGPEALAGPMAAPYDIVRFFYPGKEGAGPIDLLPLSENSPSGHAGALIKINGIDVHFIFAPQFEYSIASASAAKAIIDQNGGEFDVETSQMLIAHGVMRPVRKLRLEKPVSIGRISLASMLVRMNDYGLIERDVPSGGDGEILVSRTKQNGSDEAFVYLGRDAIGECAEISFYKRRKQVLIKC